MNGAERYKRFLVGAGFASLRGMGLPAEEPPPAETGPELVGSTDWRQNFELAKPDIEASPLPTRQLKRMAARGLARAVSSVQRIEERKKKKLSIKRTRALAAAEAHATISQHRDSQ